MKFLSRGSGYGLYLTSKEAALVVCKTGLGKARANFQDKQSLVQKSTACGVMRMQLTGASGKTELRGEEQLPGSANYFIGSDPSKWRTNVPTYAKVRYTGVYPGIDLVYSGNQRQLEFDFVVAPDAEPGRIRLGFAAPDKLHLGANEDMGVVTANETLAIQKPFTVTGTSGATTATGTVTLNVQ